MTTLYRVALLGVLLVSSGCFSTQLRTRTEVTGPAVTSVEYGPLVVQAAQIRVQPTNSHLSEMQLQLQASRPCVEVRSTPVRETQVRERHPTVIGGIGSILGMAGTVVATAFTLTNAADGHTGPAIAFGAAAVGMGTATVLTFPAGADVEGSGTDSTLRVASARDGCGLVPGAGYRVQALDASGAVVAHAVADNDGAVTLPVSLAAVPARLVAAAPEDPQAFVAVALPLLVNYQPLRFERPLGDATLDVHVAEVRLFADRADVTISVANAGDTSVRLDALAVNVARQPLTVATPVELAPGKQTDYRFRLVGKGSVVAPFADGATRVELENFVAFSQSLLPELSLPPLLAHPVSLTAAGSYLGATGRRDFARKLDVPLGSVLRGFADFGGVGRNDELPPAETEARPPPPPAAVRAFELISQGDSPMVLTGAGDADMVPVATLREAELDVELPQTTLVRGADGAVVAEFVLTCTRVTPEFIGTVAHKRHDLRQFENITLMAEALRRDAKVEVDSVTVCLARAEDVERFDNSLQLGPDQRSALRVNTGAAPTTHLLLLRDGIMIFYHGK